MASKYCQFMFELDDTSDVIAVLIRNKDGEIALQFENNIAPQEIHALASKLHALANECKKQNAHVF